MAATANRFRPDYAVSPGWILNEHLEVHGISQAEFARRCGRSAKLISEIVAGKAPIEPETALQFEKVSGMDASVWLGLEKNYRLHLARKAEAADAADAAAWLKTFPVRELARRGAIPRPESGADAFSKLLSFFRVGSVEAWRLKYSLASVAYRHSPSFESDEAALATWLRLGEIDAEGQECAEYDQAGFNRALRDIRGLTRAPIEEALPRWRRLCNQSGVALALVKPLPKAALSGAARWLTQRKAVIQLSARHRSDDHLWFTFFHEAAHIRLHSKKCIFVDKFGGGGAGLEAQANEWAANILVPPADWVQFVGGAAPTMSTVQDFAKEQGIAPGIVVGRLQHEGHIPWSGMNGLKVRYKWRSD